MFGVGSIPWFPLSRGLLTRPFDGQSERRDSDWASSTSSSVTFAMLNVLHVCRALKNWKFHGLDSVVNRMEVAKKRAIGMAHVSIAWILSKPGVTAPIVATTSLDKLKDIIGGVDVKLTEEEIKYLEEPYGPQNLIGHS